MSDSPGKPGGPPAPRPRPAAPGGPPRLDRVPEGYRPPPVVRPAAEAPRPTPAPIPGATYGLAAREVGADAAIAAGLPLQGSLDTDSALRLYGLAAATRASGRLTIAPPGRSYTLVFKKGTVEHAASTDPADELGRFLLRKGVLTPETLVAAEAARAAAGGDLVTALFAEKLVSPGDAAALLQEHGAGLVLRALAFEGGTFAWEPKVAPPPSAFPLGAPFAALCAAVRALDVSAVKRRLRDREERALSPVAGRVRVEELRLTPQEARASGLFDGTRSPAELATAHPGDAATILRVALLLAELDLAAFGAARKATAPAPEVGAARPAAPQAPRPPPAAAVPPSAVTPPPAVARPAVTPPPAAASVAMPAVAPAPVVAAKPAASPAPAPAAKPHVTPPPRPPPPVMKPSAPATAGPALTPIPRAGATVLELAALQALLAKMDGKDHFAVLGVKKETPAPQVKVAYFQLAKAYHPDAVPTGAAPDVKKLCADVFARVSEAWSVLSDERRRAAYLEELASGGAPDVDVMNILHAENLFQTGTLLVKGRKYDEARARFDEAIKLNPDEAEFTVWKAWCDFLLAADRKRQLAASAAVIEAALKKNGMCIPGYLFLGQMAKLTGDLGGAERQLRRGLQVSPDHAELLRELKYLKK